MEISGGAGMFKSSGLERLLRDARCGRFHPANALLTHEIVAKATLGVDLGEHPAMGMIETTRPSAIMVQLRMRTRPWPTI